jgi:hypothetical protein
LGHRDRELIRPKPTNQYRILVLGDSFTVGRNVRQEDAYPQRIEHHLHLAGHSARVVNAGVGGWNPFQYNQYLENYGHSLEPDMLIVGFFVGNDTIVPHTEPVRLPTAIMGRRVSSQAASSRFSPIRVLLYQHSHLARLILNPRPAGFSFARLDCRDFSDRFLRIQKKRAPINHRRTSDLDASGFNRSMGQLALISRTATALDIPLLVVLIPEESQINPDLQEWLVRELPHMDFNFDQPQGSIVAQAADRGIEVLDLLPFFREDERCLYMNDTHWTPAGHDMAARLISLQIEASGILR